jgi:hypothetical protein
VDAKIGDLAVFLVYLSFTLQSDVHEMPVHLKNLQDIFDLFHHQKILSGYFLKKNQIPLGIYFTVF